ncbi:DeoR/GlpR family DNA-binding transcription regulator [Psittacicella gerlachiana]|uniref:HTH deoR-type domain-containing protein n=1 Tax=Psittacicella gerlachiana TaxID=2028574 RepID=A0A3A1YEQ7_9GAMM|nr:DeoR/GlpR family DNA-binding transcription regulator [Psittacicella gerlachiana]RIY36165.1 hypothetical protein CKF59_02915 [Psittacicella gerlachiana]
MRKKVLRQAVIVKSINENSYLSVEDLQKLLNVSQITIRRDLAELEKKKLIVRKLGGAVSAKGAVNDHSSLTKFEDEISSEIDLRGIDTIDDILKIKGIKTLNEESYDDSHVHDSFDHATRSEEELRDLSYRCKLAIAKQAASLIHHNSRVAIDSGSTTAELVRFLDNKKRLLIMTNSLNIGFELSKLPEESRPNIILTGGLLDSHSESLYSKSMIPALKEYSLDICFVGADGFSDKGTTTKFERPSFTKVMSDISRFTVVLIESAKITNRQPNDELNWEDIDLVITDSLIPRKVRKSLMKTVEVIAADIDDLPFK